MPFPALATPTIFRHSSQPSCSTADVRAIKAVPVSGTMGPFVILGPLVPSFDVASHGDAVCPHFALAGHRQSSFAVRIFCLTAADSSLLLVAPGVPDTYLTCWRVSPLSATIRPGFCSFIRDRAHFSRVLGFRTCCSGVFRRSPRCAKHVGRGTCLFLTCSRSGFPAGCLSYLLLLASVPCAYRCCTRCTLPFLTCSQSCNSTGHP